MSDLSVNASCINECKSWVSNRLFDKLSTYVRTLHDPTRLIPSFEIKTAAALHGSRETEVYFSSGFTICTYISGSRLFGPCCKGRNAIMYEALHYVRELCM